MHEPDVGNREGHCKVRNGLVRVGVHEEEKLVGDRYSHGGFFTCQNHHNSKGKGRDQSFRTNLDECKQVIITDEYIISFRL